MNAHVEGIPPAVGGLEIRQVAWHQHLMQALDRYRRVAFEVHGAGLSLRSSGRRALAGSWLLAGRLLLLPFEQGGAENADVGDGALLVCELFRPLRRTIFVDELHELFELLGRRRL